MDCASDVSSLKLSVNLDSHRQLLSLRMFLSCACISSMGLLRCACGIRTWRMYLYSRLTPSIVVGCEFQHCPTRPHLQFEVDFSPLLSVFILERRQVFERRSDSTLNLAFNVNISGLASRRIITSAFQKLDLDTIFRRRLPNEPLPLVFQNSLSNLCVLLGLLSDSRGTSIEHDSLSSSTNRFGLWPFPGPRTARILYRLPSA